MLNPLSNPPTLNCQAGKLICATASTPIANPMTLTWNNKLYNYGANLQELQIYRDPELASQNYGPFYAITSPMAFAQGRVDLTPEYALGAQAEPWVIRSTSTR